MPDPTPALLVSTLPPSRGQQRAAFAVGAALLVFFLAALPFADEPLPRFGATVPVVSSFMLLGDFVTAVLLFGQFAVLRTRSLVVLACGYLFTGALVAPYALTFPGAFSETGLLGANLQTAAWLFLFWHSGLPVAVMAYALLDGRGSVRMPVQRAIGIAVAVALAGAGLCAWFAIHQTHLLPPVTLDAVRMSRQTGVLAPVVALSIAAVAMMAKRRRSVLDLWLLVVCFAWVLDSALTYMTESRYTGAWYANRVVRVVAANVVLFVLVAESTLLYARLAATTLAQQRERQRRGMTLDAMSAAIEHEVRQPLAAIGANASAARRWLGHDPPNLGEANGALDDISASVTRATGILHAVRQLFARHDEEQKPLDANAIVTEGLALARSELDMSEIAVRLQLAPGELRTIGNRLQLQDVVANLVRNAAEAMPPAAVRRATLTLSSRALPDQRIEVCVADDGPGIAKSDEERIFEPFFTTKPDGMGMGLALCRSIVERHGGTLSVSSATPRGCVFRIVLPAA